MAIGRSSNVRSFSPSRRRNAPAGRPSVPPACPSARSAHESRGLFFISEVPDGCRSFARLSGWAPCDLCSLRALPGRSAPAAPGWPAGCFCAPSSRSPFGAPGCCRPSGPVAPVVARSRSAGALLGAPWSGALCVCAGLLPLCSPPAPAGLDCGCELAPPGRSPGSERCARLAVMDAARRAAAATDVRNKFRMEGSCHVALPRASLSRTTS